MLRIGERTPEAHSTEQTTESRTHSTETESQPAETRAAADQQYQTGSLSFLNIPPSDPIAERSASPVNSVGESSSAASDDPDTQKLLTKDHWNGEYSKKYNEAKTNGDKPESYADLRTDGKYWNKYDPNTKGKVKKGEERKIGAVKDLFPGLDKELEARRNQSSLALYKSLPTDRDEIGGHFGDYDHAKTYYDRNKGEQQKMLKFTLKPGAHELLFSPKYMALSPKGEQHRTLAELSTLKGEGPYPFASESEGYLGGYIGLKPEGANGFSLGFKQGNKASEELFKHFVSNVEVGRPDEDGEFKSEGAWSWPKAEG